MTTRKPTHRPTPRPPARPAAPTLPAPTVAPEPEPEVAAAAPLRPDEAAYRQVADRGGAAMPIREIVLVDGYGQRTHLNLAQQWFHSHAMQSNAPMPVTGEGEILEIDLDRLYMHNDSVIEFDPPPSERQPLPVRLRES